MRLGLHALGIGPAATPGVITALATAADAAGFSTLWAGEHIVMVDRPDSPYPYSPDGRIAVASDADWLDPLAALAFAAAVTSQIRLATGVLLLPEHHPVVVAKQAASLDTLSGGRFALGIGIGWSSEEFAALGIPFAGRARRSVEYVEAMRVLWSDDPATFSGEFVHFTEVRCHPKPQGRRLPVVWGGNSDAALDRAAAHGDGWYGFNLTAGTVAERVDHLTERCRLRGGDPSAVEINVALVDPDPGQVPWLEALGVSELVLVETPPERPEQVGPWLEALADRWDIGRPGSPWTGPPDRR